MDIKEVLLQWLIDLLIKKAAGGTIKNEIKQNEQFAEELLKPITKKI